MLQKIILKIKLQIISLTMIKQKKDKKRQKNAPQLRSM